MNGIPTILGSFECYPNDTWVVLLVEEGARSVKKVLANERRVTPLVARVPTQ